MEFGKCCANSCIYYAFSKNKSSIPTKYLATVTQSLHATILHCGRQPTAAMQVYFVGYASNFEISLRDADN